MMSFIYLLWYSKFIYEDNSMKQVLVIVDMQNDFVEGILGSEEAQKVVPNIIKICKEFDRNFIYATRDTHYDDYLDTLEGKMLPIQHCLINTNGWEIIDELTKYIPSENIINKEIFGSIELANKLKFLYEKDNDLEINIVGVCTDICVVSNALLLRSTLPNVKINVIENCCAATSIENQQKALDIMKINHINIKS